MTPDRRHQPPAPEAPAEERRRPKARRTRTRGRRAARYAALAAGLVFLAAVLDGLYSGEALDQVANPARVAAARSCHVEALDVVRRSLGEGWRVSPYHQALVKDLGAGRYRVEMRALTDASGDDRRVLCSALQLDPGAGAIVAVDVRLRPEP